MKVGYTDSRLDTLRKKKKVKMLILRVCYKVAQVGMMQEKVGRLERRRDLSESLA